MKKFLLAVTILAITITGYGQSPVSKFKTINVDKKIKEFPDQFDLSSPLNSFVTLYYIYANGRNGLLRSVNTIRNKSLLPEPDAPNANVSDADKNMYIETKVDEIIYYKDSVAFVINEIEEDGIESFVCRSFYFEANKWVTSGESPVPTMEEARQFVKGRAPLFFAEYESIQDEFYKKQ